MTDPDVESDWADPETSVFATVREVLEGDGRGVLATVIAVEGSAYRRPGAKMAVPEGGAGVGRVTAGCLEDEVERLSASVLEADESVVETYDLRPEAEDDVWGLGVGCNGIIDVLVEPIDDSLVPALDRHEAGEAVAVLTVVGTEEAAAPTPSVGTRAVYDPAADAFEGDDAFPDATFDSLREVAADLTDRGKAGTVEVDGLSVFVDGLGAPDDLVVVGSGSDLGPIAELGRKAGFSVTVVSFRGGDTDPDRFPDAETVVSTSPARIREAVDLDEDTYVVVATHNFVDDRLAVDELLDSSVPYVGLMGPRERFEEMLEAFEAEGRSLSGAELDRLYTPVGLDLGEGSPYGIALSVVAEVLAVRNDREPIHLSAREGPIHDRVDLALEDE